MSVSFKFLLFFLYLVVISTEKVVLSSSNGSSTVQQQLPRAKDESPYRVTGGYRPNLHTLAKFAVSIRRRNRYNIIYKQYFGATHFCGGSILRPRLILTAAHCLQQGRRLRPSSLEVAAKTPIRLQKTSDTQILEVSKVISHRNYDAKYVKCDIGLLKLKKNINLDGQLAAAIPLPATPPTVGKTCTVIGWGKLYEDGPLANEILYVDVNIFSPKCCNEMLPLFGKKKICAADLDNSEKDSCHGDSGGPLVCDGTVAGIVSYGFGCASGRPAVYTDVYAYLDWIEKSKCNRRFQIFNKKMYFLFMILLSLYNWHVN